MERSFTVSRLTTGLVCAVLASGLLAACGGDDNNDTASTPATTEATTATTETQTTETATETTETQTSTQEASAQGKSVFTANCASCHTLADAGSSGSVGPNLDDLKPDKARVEKQVKAGGSVMPSFEGTLSAAEISAVADYVSGAAGK